MHHHNYKVIKYKTIHKYGFNKILNKMIKNVVFSRRLLVFFVLLTITPLEGLGKRGGYLNFQFLCYQNPDHLDYEGHKCDSLPSMNCDPFFIICISNKPIKGESSYNCPVYHLETKPYDNEESVCNNPVDNRDLLQNVPNIELPYPLQEVYYVRIVVKDSNQFTAHQYIAVFSTIFRGKPSPNFSNFVNTEILMTREEIKVRNPRARMKISIGLQCDWNLYGDLCVTFCRSLNTDNYVCSAQGEKICKTGWLGSECIVKDLCQNFLCAKGATCQIINNTPKCMCNGIIGPQCYPNYNPCNPNPCKNEGECVPEDFLSNGISCSCKSPYHGSRCTLKFDLCQMDPCSNNATCIVLKNGKRMCKCSPDFQGILCDHPVDFTTNSSFYTTVSNMRPLSGLRTNKNINLGVLFGVLFGLCFFIILLVSIYFVVIRKQSKKHIFKEYPITFKDLSRDSQPPCIPNEYGCAKDDTVYDTIDDRATYVYQVENNDDYLVPSRPTTPIATPGGRSDSSDYIPMYTSEDSYIIGDHTNQNTKENEYIPPLPTRTPTKNVFNFFRKLNK